MPAHRAHEPAIPANQGAKRILVPGGDVLFEKLGIGPPLCCGQTCHASQVAHYTVQLSVWHGGQPLKNGSFPISVSRGDARLVFWEKFGGVCPKTADPLVWSKGSHPA